MPFALPPATLLYPHRCTIYRSQENLAASGKSLPDTLLSTTANVECYFQTGESVKGPNGFVLGEQDNLFTLDILHFPDTVDVQVGDVITQTTGPETGRYWLARGDDQVRSQFAQKLRVRASRLGSPPDWVP
jgi:hypothetical protein